MGGASQEASGSSCQIYTSFMSYFEHATVFPVEGMSVVEDSFVFEVLGMARLVDERTCA